MAQTVHLWLKANNQPVNGDSTISSLERTDTIECLQFEDSVKAAREPGSCQASGGRTYSPIKIIKRVDKSSPLIQKALSGNEIIQGTFKFYRPAPTGAGGQEHFFTVAIEEGYIDQIKRISPDVFDPASATEPPTEEVSFVFGKITWTYEDGGISHIDHWEEQ
jgi:type VI secretion system secreted protein Hcp